MATFSTPPHIVVLNYQRFKPSSDSYELGWVEVCHFDDSFGTALLVKLIENGRIRARIFIAVFRALFSIRLELTASVDGGSSQDLQGLGGVMRRERSHFWVLAAEGVGSVREGREVDQGLRRIDTLGATWARGMG